MSNTRNRLIALAVRQSLLPGAFAALLFSGVSFAQSTSAPSDTVAQAGTTAAADQTTPATGGAPTAAAGEVGGIEGLQEVTVTGTRIRGVAPVGSTLVTIDTSATMVETGLNSTNDILGTSPVLFGLNNNAVTNSPNVHGIGVEATLTLINGHRGWVEGTSSDIFSTTNLPSQMLQRVEVVPDGTSPIYGADAISGTVNYVLRSPADVVETYFSEKGIKGQNTWDATGVFGHTWSIGEQSGGIIYGYSYINQGPLLDSSFSTSQYNNNFAPYGGAPSSTFAAPGNILLGASTYAVPTGQNGQSLTLSQLGAAGSANRQNIFAGGPGTGSDMAGVDTGTDNVINYFQNITDWLQWFGDGMYDHHETNSYTSGSVNDIAAKVPNTNPYSPCNPSHYTNGVVTGPAALVAACATGSLTVNYNDQDQVGAEWNWGIDKGWETSNGFHIKLPGDWQITPQATINQHLDYTANDTLDAPPVNTFNYFCDPTTFNCAQPGQVGVSVPQYQGLATAGPILTTGRFYQLGADGSVFTLPGGNLRTALGAEDDLFEFEKHTSTNTNPHRRDKAAYLEIYIPIVGAGNAMTGIQSLEIDAAARTDDYTDTGRTDNPKIGVNWEPIKTLKFHASAGTSFHPAYLQDLGTLLPRWTTSSISGTAILPSLCPNCTNPADFGVDGINKLVYSEAMGYPYPVLQAEHSRTLSGGFDWTPEAIPGLTAGVNWWWIKYVNQVGNQETAGGAATTLNSQLWNAHVIYNPTFFPTLALNNPLAFFEPTPLTNFSDPNCAAVVGKRVTTQALYNQFLACSNDNSGGQNVTGTTSVDPNDVIAYTYFGQLNSGSTLGDGFDLDGAYAWHNDWGNWKATYTGEYVPRLIIAPAPGAPEVNEAGHLSYMPRFKSRLQLNWQREFSFGSLTPNVFLNYSGSQHEDASLLPVGVPEHYANIDPRVTVDASIVYETGTSLHSWIGNNVTMTLSSQNVLNAAPPLAISGSTLFDGSTGWPPSRILQFLIAKKW